MALAGRVVSQVYDQGRSFDVTVKMNDNSRSEMERIGNLTIDANGQKIPLNYIAELVSSSGPNTINRENAQRKIVISANVAGRDLRGVVNDIQKIVKNDVPLPEGYHIEYGGQFESEQAASRIFALHVAHLAAGNIPVAVPGVQKGIDGRHHHAQPAAGANRRNLQPVDHIR